MIFSADLRKTNELSYEIGSVNSNEKEKGRFQCEFFNCGEKPTIVQKCLNEDET